MKEIHRLSVPLRPLCTSRTFYWGFFFRFLIVEAFLCLGPILLFLHGTAFVLHRLFLSTGSRSRRPSGGGGGSGSRLALDDEAVELVVVDVETADDVPQVLAAESDDPLDDERIVLAESDADDVGHHRPQVFLARGQQQLCGWRGRDG